MRVNQIYLSIRAVPEIIFSALLPVIPRDNFISNDSRVIEENIQNSSKFGYIGGGFGKKSM